MRGAIGTSLKQADRGRFAERLRRAGAIALPHPELEVIPAETLRERANRGKSVETD
jgi:uroporphyrinogen-III synthase